MSDENLRKFCAAPTGIVSELGGPFIREHVSSFDGSTQAYAMYVPESYDPKRAWPLVISLHGHSSDHILNLRRLFGRGNAPDEPDCGAKVCFPGFPSVDFLAASPYAFGSIWYDGPGEVDVLDVLADVRANYNVDPDRIYLTGLSMGGGGTWQLAVRYPDLFAAIAPVCGMSDDWLWSRPRNSYESELSITQSPVTLAGNLRHTPVSVFHGAEDETVPVEHSRRMVERLEELGCHVHYEEYPGVGHNAWSRAYADASIFHWFKLFKRVSRPRFVEFSTPKLRWGKAWWIRIDQIKKRPELAVVKAEVMDGNTIEVTTENVQALTITPSLAPLEPATGITVIWNGLEVFRGVPEEDEIELGDASRLLSKRAGLEGPVGDAFRDRYLLVYGTQGIERKAIQAGREAAAKLADQGDWGDIVVPMKPDAEVTEDDVKCFNLILIGNPKTNSMIDFVNGYLPVRFDGQWVQAGRRLLTGHDMGMIVVSPNPQNPSKYIVVLGGDTAKTIKMAAENYGTAPDYIVFDAASDFAVESTLRDWGYFNHSWGLE